MSIRDRDDEDDPADGPHMTRRALLQSAGVAVLASSWLGSDDASAIDSVQGEVVDNPAGLKVRVTDRVGGYLPPGTTYEVIREDMDYDESDVSTGAWAFLPPQATGKFAVAADAPLLADTRAAVGEKALTYQFELAQAANAYAPGAEVTVTDQPLIASSAFGAERLILEVGGESVPRQTEGADAAAGFYTVDEGAITYRPGRSPPASKQATLRIFEGIPQEGLDDATRRL